MIEILLTILFIVVFVKAVGLALRISWGVTKAIACVLFVIALPVVVGCLLFAGGLILLLPVILVIIAFGILKAA